MKKMLIAVAVGVALALCPLTWAEADYPGPREKIVCSDVKISRDSDTAAKITVWAVVRYRTCVKNSSVKFRKLLSLAVGYSANYDPPCNWADPFERVAYKAYFWDNLGRNFNPPGFKLGCSTDGSNQRVLALRDVAPRLYYAAGHPQWKVNAKIELSWGVPDPHVVLRGKLS